VRFSSRLPWDAAENRLTGLEAQRRAKGEILDLTVTNPTRVGIDYPVEELALALGDARAATYDPAPLGLTHARAAVAGSYAARGAPIRAEQIVLTASSSESYAVLLKLLCDPGDAVLVPTPSYPLFEYLARLEGVDPRRYRLAYDGTWHIDHSSIDVRGARAVAVVSPNNPTGSYVSSDDWDRLVSLGLPLIVDEVFTDYPLAPQPDAVRVAASRAAGALTFSLGGLSKSCGLPQLKLGWIAVTGPDEPVRQALAGLELICDTYLSVGTPVQLALPRLLELGAGIRTSVAGRLAMNRDLLGRAIPPASACTLLPTEAGWSAILRVPGISSEEGWALRLLAEDGVLVQPGYFFDLELGTTLVVSLLTPPVTFAEGIRRLLARVQALT